MNRLRFIKVREVKAPSRANPFDAGLDFYIPTDLHHQDLQECNIKDFPEDISFLTISDDKCNIKSISLLPNKRILIPSGIQLLIEPKDSMLMAANKSGISTKMGLIFTAEIVDSPYVGELHIGVYNTSNIIQTLEAGQKLIQFIHVPIFVSNPEEITHREFNALSSSWGSRGLKGFGSSDLL